MNNYSYQGTPGRPSSGQSQPPTSSGAPSQIPPFSPHYPSSYGFNPVPSGPSLSAINSNMPSTAYPHPNGTPGAFRQPENPNYLPQQHQQHYPGYPSALHQNSSYPRQQPPPYPPQQYPNSPPYPPQNYPNSQPYPPQNYSNPQPYPPQMNQSYQAPSACPYPPQPFNVGAGTGTSANANANYGERPYSRDLATGVQYTPNPMTASPYNTSMIQKTYSPKLTPTIVRDANFNPRTDAELLRKAMKGFGTDESAITSILANRTNLQRQEIAHQFKSLYGKDLIKDLKSELSGNYEKLIIAMMTPLPEYFAHELHHALSGLGTDDDLLCEIFCTLANQDIRVINNAYRTLYGKSLEQDIRDDTSGNFKRLMTSLSCANRNESNEVNQAEAVNDAKRLLQAGELRLGTDESTWNTIFAERNVLQLKQIFQEYSKITGHTIETAIENEFSGDIKKGLLTIAKVVNNRPGYYAERLYKSMKGLGTNDRDLIRIVVTRSEVDMGEIKQMFLSQYGKSLDSFISDDCSGHYKKCLLAIIT